MSEKQSNSWAFVFLSFTASVWTVTSALMDCMIASNCVITRRDPSLVYAEKVTSCSPIARHARGQAVGSIIMHI